MILQTTHPKTVPQIATITNVAGQVFTSLLLKATTAFRLHSSMISLGIRSIGLKA